jgi:hypothetical protein
MCLCVSAIVCVHVNCVNRRGPHHHCLLKGVLLKSNVPGEALLLLYWLMLAYLSMSSNESIFNFSTFLCQVTKVQDMCDLNAL